MLNISKAHIYNAVSAMELKAMNEIHDINVEKNKVDYYMKLGEINALTRIKHFIAVIQLKVRKKKMTNEQWNMIIELSKQYDREHKNEIDVMNKEIELVIKELNYVYISELLDRIAKIIYKYRITKNREMLKYQTEEQKDELN